LLACFLIYKGYFYSINFLWLKLLFLKLHLLLVLLFPAIFSLVIKIPFHLFWLRLLFFKFHILLFPRFHNCFFLCYKLSRISKLTFLEFASKSISVWKQHFSFTMELILKKFTFVFSAIFPDMDTLTLPLAVDKLTLVLLTI